MFLKFSNFFVFLLIVTILYLPNSFAAERDSPSTEPDTKIDTSVNPTENSPEKESGVAKESITTEKTKEKFDENYTDEFSGKPTTTNQAPDKTKQINFLDGTKKNRRQEKRAPIVSTSEISNAIDKDYSFLYDPNMKSDLIKDMTDNPDSYVIMYLETGDSILIKLKEDIAPNTVVRFKKLVKEHFYDDMEIFRAIPDYLIQTGDPSGSGYGGKGVFYFAEINPNEKFKRGTIAMSNNGNLQSDDTQFFITFNSFDWLDGKYTIFGEVILGMGKLENVSKTFANDGFVNDPSIITKIEFLSQRPSDSIDDLSKIIPPEKQKEALKKQKENKQREEAKQKFLIENEKDTVNKAKIDKGKSNTADLVNKDDNTASVDEQEGSKSSPY